MALPGPGAAAAARPPDAFASELDGVGSADVERAVAAHAQHMRTTRSGPDPEPARSLRASLAIELGRGEDEISVALQNAGEAEAKRRQLQLLASLEESVSSGAISAGQAKEIRARITAGPAIPARRGFL
jgi:hypothetical protein